MAIVLNALAVDGTTGELLGVETGTGVLVNGRDSARYAWSDEDLAYSVPAYEAAWNGGRPVQNLVTSSEDLTNAAWTHTATTDSVVLVTFGASGQYISEDIATTEGHTYIFSFWARNVTGNTTMQARHNNSATGNTTAITIDGTLKRYSFIVLGRTGDGDVSFGLQDDSGSGWGQAEFTKIQVEDVTGRADMTVPSEYVENGTGNGYAVYGTENGNSVASNVVTEGVGAALSPVPRLSHCPAATNSILYSNNLAETTWTNPTTAIRSFDQIGFTGAPNTATLVGDDSSGGTGYVWVRCSVTITSGAPNCFILYAKKAQLSYVGFGMYPFDGEAFTYIDLDTLSIVSTQHDEAEIYDLGNGWCKCIVEFSSTTVISGNVIIYLAETGGSKGPVDLDGTSDVYVGNIEAYVNRGIAEVRDLPPIFTEAAAVSTTADDYTLDITNHSNTVGTYTCEWTPSYATSEVSGDLEIVSLTTAAGLLYYDGTNGNVESTDGTNTSTKAETVVAEMTYDLEVDYSTSGNSLQVTVDTVAGSAESYDGGFTTGAEIVLFRNNAYANELFALVFDDGSVGGTSIPVFMHHYTKNIG